MELFCLFITAAILFSYYRLVAMLTPGGVASRLLSSFVLTCGQIILTELSLGLLGQLYLSYVLIMNLSLVVFVMVAAGRLRRAGQAVSTEDGGVHAKDAGSVAFDRYTMVLAAVIALVYGWILVAAYYLPARGIDDLAYHLPAVFEYVRSHEIRLLPVAGTPPFAFPENAELLFLWPVLFTHDQRMVDAVNVPFVLLSVLALYALARHFSLPKNESLFTALLYALCPVVLMQAGVNYVDIIVSAFLLLSMYFTLRYYEHRRLQDICLAALATGLLCGMKYTAPFLVLPLQLLIWPRIRKQTWHHALAYGSIIAVAGGWWYVRNAFVLGEPLFPMHFQPPVPEGLVNVRGGSILQNIRYNSAYWIARYPLRDSGVGTYDGGFGLVFWGMCVSSWLVMTLRASAGILKLGPARLVVLSYLPAGFLLLLALPPRFVDVDGRLAMFVVAIGLLAFAEVLRFIGDSACKAIIKGIALVLSAVTVSLIFVSVQPLYRFGDALADSRNDARASEFRYLAASFAPHVDLRPAWELLDLLSRDDRRGFNCAIASDFALYWPSPVYGSRLQNRVLNMDRAPMSPADAYVCTYLDKRRLEERPGEASGPETPAAAEIRNVVQRDDYVTVVHSDHACLLLRRDIFGLPEKQVILQAYYRTAWPDAIVLAQGLDGQLRADIPVVADNEIGYAVRYVDMTQGRQDRVYPAVDGRDGKLAMQKNLKQCYSFHRPLSGFQSRKVSQVLYKGKELDVFLNRR